MSFPTYEQYKESGFQWLGMVPDAWEVNISRRYFYEIREPGKSDDIQLSATQKFGVVPQTMFMDMEDQKVVLALKGLSNFKHVEPDDFVISLRSFQGGIERSKYRGCVSPAYTVLRPKKIIDPAFIAYVFKSAGYIVALQSVTDGIREGKNIKYDQFAELGLALPTVTEQKIIAKFLDHETAKIDSLVAEQEKLIELLKEKRQAVISHAVTKGVDLKVKMKDSGLEWLGEVPENWDVVPLKYFVSMRSGEQITSEQIRDEGAFPVYGGNGLRGYFEKYTHDGEYPLIGRQGALCGNINYANGKFWASEHAVVVTPQKRTNIFYLGELLRSMNLGQYSTSAAQPGLSVEAIGNLRIPAPKLEEQNQIADYLMIESDKWESLIGAATKSISLFQERKSALVLAAVTGQIDVRNYRAKEVA